MMPVKQAFVPHPALPGVVVRQPADWGDQAQEWPTVEHGRVYDGPFLAVRRDVLANNDGSSFDRYTVEHPGAVGIVALDDMDRVLLLAQYRASVRRRLLQLPAGILDIEGESLVDSAARELAEEADLTAARWEPLLDMWPTTGSSDELWHLFLARGLSPVPVTDRYRRVHEEADMERLWMPISDVVTAIHQGRIMDGMVVAGVLAADAFLAR
jgi:8-oxo-dGTP pyrophosphatase MutT (NUDIX family)